MNSIISSQKENILGGAKMLCVLVKENTLFSSQKCVFFHENSFNVSKCTHKWICL